MKTQIILLLALGETLTAGATLRKSVCLSGCDFAQLQPAIDWAVAQQSLHCEDVVLELNAGQVFSGVFVLPEKSCGRYIRIRSSRLGELPAGVRVQPTDAGKLAHLELPSSLGTDRVLRVDRGGFWALEGLQVSQPVTPFLNYGLIQIGEYAPAVNRRNLLPHHVIVDRCYIHGQPNHMGPVRGILLNSQHVEIVNSYISEIKAGVDAQAIASLQSAGPLLIKNNYLEASGMSFLAGGASNTGQSEVYIAGMAQRAGRFWGNHLRKRPEWLQHSGSLPPAGECLPGSYYKQVTTSTQWHRCDAGAWQLSETGAPSYTIKNSWELKDGQAYELIGNVVENSWQQAQNGFSILINQSGNTTRNYDVIDTLIRGNRIIRANTGFAMGNLNYLEPNGVTLTRRVNVEHNVFSIGAAYLRVSPQISRAFTVIESEGVRLARNTLRFEGYIHSVYSSGDYRPYPTLSGFHQISENILDSSDWLAAGLFGNWFVFNAGFSSTCGITAAVPQRGGVVTFSKNVAPGPGTRSQGPCPASGLAPIFPADHLLTPSLADVVNDVSNGNFTVRNGHPAQAAAWDGGDLGADQVLVERLTANTVPGTATTVFEARIRSIQPGSNSGVVRFTAPGPEPCSVQVSLAENLGSAAGGSAQFRVGRAGTINLTGLASGLRYFVGVNCGGWVMRASFRTTP